MQIDAVFGEIECEFLVVDTDCVRIANARMYSDESSLVHYEFTHGAWCVRYVCFTPTIFANGMTSAMQMTDSAIQHNSLLLILR